MHTKVKRGNEEIRKARRELGITQEELSFSGMTKSVIAKLECGERKLNSKQASRLAARFEELGYEISSKVLMGQDRDIDEVLKSLETNINKEKLEEIDNIILNLNNDKAVELILGIVDILKKDIYLYASVILKYILKLNGFNINKETYINVNMELMRIYTVLCNYDSVLIVASAISIYEDEFNKKESTSYNFNIANAYYYLGDYDKSDKYLNKAKKFNERSSEMHILTVKSNICTMKRKFKEAIELNNKIIARAKEQNKHFYIANSLSNIAFILTEQEELEEAQKYINEAFTFYDSIDTYYRFNLVNNKFYLDIKKNIATFEEFKQLIILALESKDTDRLSENVILYFSYYTKNENPEKGLTRIINFLNKNNIVLEEKAKLELIRYTYGKPYFDMITEKIIKLQ